MRGSVAAFRTEYHNYQDAAFVSGQLLVGNADRLELKVLKLEGAAILGVWGLTLNLAVSFADLSYASNTTGVCYSGRVADGRLPRSCNLTGEHPIDAPPWTTSASLQHERRVSWGKLFARIGVSWNDQYNTSFSADPRLIQEPRLMSECVSARGSASDTNARFGWITCLTELTQIDSALNLFNDAELPVLHVGTAEPSLARPFRIRRECAARYVPRRHGLS